MSGKYLALLIYALGVNSSHTVCQMPDEMLNSDWDLYDGDTKMHTDTKDYQIEEKEDCHIVTLDLPPFTGRMFALS